jgi:acetyltransferase-like isoleucine patch superfamily enzyme
MSALDQLKSASKYLPKGMQDRLRARVRKHRSAKLGVELLMAPRFPEHSIGPHSVGMPEIRVGVGNLGKLTIGDYCSVAEGVAIMLGGEHGTDRLTTFPFWELWPAGLSLRPPPASKGDISIGNDVWIGTNTLILSGTSIGDGAVIGAGSVVRGKIPPYAIAVGNPCRTALHRFKPDEIKTLLALRWWDWPQDVVAKALPILLGSDVDAIVEFGGRHKLFDQPQAL